MKLNDLPKNGKIYFAGIGGISMSGLAMTLKKKGFEVIGHDRAPNDATKMLEENNIKIFYNTAISNLEGVSCAIFSAALNNEHPEIVNINAKKIPLFSRAQLLGAIIDSFDDSIGVAGTHGKSSTSGMISHVAIESENADPTVLIGAMLPSLKANYRLGNDQRLIFEADEYKDSFLKFRPKTSVVLNLMLDHTDYFQNLDRLISSFSGYINNTQQAVLNLDSDSVMLAARDFKGKKLTFSVSGNENADFYAKNISFYKGYPRFEVYHDNELFANIQLSVPGLHNAANALAAVIGCHLLGISREDIEQHISTYCGVCRRFEFRGTLNGAKVYDDYAHHPDEIRANLAAAKLMGYKRIISVFQPHTYTRFNDLFDSFADSFGDSDINIFAEIYSAREENKYNVSSAKLAEAVKNSLFYQDFDGIENYLRDNAREGDLILFMGAGNITELSRRFV